MPTSRVSGVARVALAAIRIVNGSTALIAPRVLTRQIPARSAALVTAISALNTALALTAWAGQRRTRVAA